MRILVLTAIVAAGIGMTFPMPFLGIVLWHWLSLMNPHQLTFGGFFAGLPMIVMSAVTTLIAWLISTEPKRLPATGLNLLFLTLTVWMSVGVLFAVLPEGAFERWDETIRKLIMVFVTIAMTTTMARIQILVWVMVVSVGFFGVKGGVFSIMTGGTGRVMGAGGTTYADNNTLGMALLMIVPLMAALMEIAKTKRVKQCLMASIGLTVISILLTYSRGALLGLVVLGAFIWLTSRRKVLVGVVIFAAIVGGAPFIPEQWYDRMNTIEKYEEDGSSTSRLRQWHLAFEIAKERPLFGGGFRAFFSREVSDRLTPIVGPGIPLEAHSIYFQMLGEHGFVGLFLFLAIGVGSAISCMRTYLLTRGRPDLLVPNRLARGLFLALCGYASAGAFLSQAYLDLFYLIVAVTICMSIVVRRCLKEGVPEEPANLKDWMLAALRPPARPLSGVVHN